MEALRDEQLMSGVLTGDESALNALVERHYGPLLGYVYRLLHGDRQLAEDAVQETFLRMMQRGGYQSGRPFKPWLYTIATNIIRDYFKSAVVKHGADATDDILLAVYDPAPGPEDIALSDEQGKIISVALGKIGEEYRSTILLRFYAGLSLQEIAETLHIPVGTVKSRLSVGTRRLRAALHSMKEYEVK
ncbi:RNA polymerase sigma factor [Dictyobacter kobayashii]|uniref:RNA polymerase sigma24 factor n=1 Tax=Dictyobacter kobayashii TaxID=2014872 RepID=A0A402AEY3_9CHLR|nr:RNA polymerase sigma factor [Dictyobacter kobayashii]GCE17646.1 RNA polymerase sigma24 factor [Dictyobacter kobayashii]